MKRIYSLTIILALVLALTACGSRQTAVPVKMLIVPHFEIGELSGDFAGEAQLFYDKYMTDCQAYDIGGGYTLYYDAADAIAMCITGSGKVNATACLTAVLGDSRFDFTDAYIMSVGCAGGAIEYANLGDVCLATGTYDYDMGHTCVEYGEDSEPTRWYHDTGFDDVDAKELNLDLINSLYAQVKDTTLETTELSQSIYEKNFGQEVQSSNSETLDIFEPAMRNVLAVSSRIIDILL